MSVTITDQVALRIAEALEWGQSVDSFDEVRRIAEFLRECVRCSETGDLVPFGIGVARGDDHGPL